MADHSPSQNNLDGKVAIITGGASGIGEATARHFADHGARVVVIADIQDEKGQLVAESIGSHRCRYVRCDVTDEQQVKALVDSTVESYGQLDVMFCNAGIMSIGLQDVLDLDLSAYDRLFAVNVRGAAASVKHSARAMVEGKVKGSIICMASVAASTGSDKFIDYVMSKTAVLGLVKSASRQLGEYGIRVNGVSPGAVATPLLLDKFQMTAAEAENQFEHLMFLKGAGPLKEKNVADAVLFLASDNSKFVTGHNLIVDGGYPH